MPTVTVVSPTIQHFNGTNYYKCGKYYQKNGIRLHRVVWQHFNGEIPDGFHVHHIDEDRSNNEPTNLELKTGAEHLRGHMTEERRQWARENVKKAIAAAPEWHRSEVGREWHRAHARKALAKTWERHRTAGWVDYICYMCLGVAKGKASMKGAFFCCAACRTQAHTRGVTVSRLRALSLKPIRMSTT